MNEFLVSWDIELTADNAVAAAIEAQSAQRDPDSLATSFTVSNCETLECHIVNLSDFPASVVPCPTDESLQVMKRLAAAIRAKSPDASVAEVNESENAYEAYEIAVSPGCMVWTVNTDLRRSPRQGDCRFGIALKATIDHALGLLRTEPMTERVAFEQWLESCPVDYVQMKIANGLRGVDFKYRED